jgi:hypothetical protein
MRARHIVGWTILLVVVWRLPGSACQRDESQPPGSPLAARGDEVAPMWEPPPPMFTARSAVLAPIVTSPMMTFIRHDLDSSPFGQVTEGINVGDIDGDGRPDLVVGGDQYLL